jgi:hypothetical protein
MGNIALLFSRTMCFRYWEGSIEKYTQYEDMQWYEKLYRIQTLLGCKHFNILTSP